MNEETRNAIWLAYALLIHAKDNPEELFIAIEEAIGYLGQALDG